MREFTPSTFKRFWSKVDKAGPCWLWTSSLDRSGYGQFFYEGKARSAHRLSYTQSVGEPEPGLVIDHLCHTPSCVKPSHMRAVTQLLNQENRRGLPVNNVSGYRGVYWHKQRQKWRANVGHAGMKHHVGYFGDLEEAAAAVVQARNSLHQNNDLDRLHP